MAKLLLAIEVPDNVVASIESGEPDWFPLAANQISLDRAYLTTNPDEDDFYLFEFLGIQKETP